MMRSIAFELKDFTARCQSKISGSLVQKDSQLIIRYAIDAAPASLLWPEPTGQAEFRDLLWQGTCLEVFYAKPSSPGYIEWNFSPAGHWACYQFVDYRTGQKRLTERRAVIKSGKQGNHYWLESHVPIEEERPLDWNICVILQDAQAQSFWSLLHPGGKPDFHDRRGFIIKA
ncbi:MAG: hypothetical protein ACOH5I_19250 [Oligoflexus sp.]